MFMGFTLHFYIIFGTNVLTGGPAHIAIFFCLFQYFKEKEYQKESKWNETFGSDLFGTNMIQGTWSGRQATQEATTRVGACPPPRACLAPSWPPRLLLDVHSKSPGLRLFQKDHSRRFHSVWTPFDILFFETSK